jgi:hypothetical protein
MNFPTHSDFLFGFAIVTEHRNDDDCRRIQTDSNSHGIPSSSFIDVVMGNDSQICHTLDDLIELLGDVKVQQNSPKVSKS